MVLAAALRITLPADPVTMIFSALLAMIVAALAMFVATLATNVAINFQRIVIRSPEMFVKVSDLDLLLLNC